MHIWQLSLKPLGVHGSDTTRRIFQVFVICKESQNEVEVVKFAKLAIHSPDWWNGYIITKIEYVGMAWAFQAGGNVEDNFKDGY